MFQEIESEVILDHDKTVVNPPTNRGHNIALLLNPVNCIDTI